MKTEIWVTFNYGGWTLSFSKTFELPFVPFVGLHLDDSDDEDEHIVELAENEYCTTYIGYNVKKKMFEVNVRNHWKRPVTDETIDSKLTDFKKNGWSRRDSTNIAELKELMLRNQLK